MLAVIFSICKTESESLHLYSRIQTGKWIYSADNKWNSSEGKGAYNCPWRSEVYVGPHPRRSTHLSLCVAAKSFVAIQQDVDGLSRSWKRTKNISLSFWWKLFFYGIRLLEPWWHLDTDFSSHSVGTKSQSLKSSLSASKKTKKARGVRGT